MECEICMEYFDHSIHEPYVLIPCSHTFCISCIQKLQNDSCPTCKRKTIDKNPNWIMFKIVEKSFYDKTKQSLVESLNEINSLKFKFESVKERKYLENSLKLKSLRNDINSKTNELINSLLNKREKLLDEANNVEDFLTQSLGQITFETDFVSETKRELETNELDENHLNKLFTRTNLLKSELENKITLVEQFANDYGFTLNKSLIYCEIGEISNQNWVSFNNFKIFCIVESCELLSCIMYDRIHMYDSYKIGHVEFYIN